MGTQSGVSVQRYDSSTTRCADEEQYAVFWIKEGVEAITIDRDRFLAQPNSIFFVVRGARVCLDYGANPQGWILRFSDAIFRDVTQHLVIKDADIFSAFGRVPRIILSPRISARVAGIAEMIDELVGSRLPNREIAIASLLRTLLIYCDSECNVHIADDANTAQVQIVTQYKDLVAQHYTETHRVSDYARMLHITPKYLNQVTNEILGMTAKSIIHEQLTIQARRELKFSNDSVKQIAFALGFSAPSHFSKYFKRQVGCSPSAYRRR